MGNFFNTRTHGNRVTMMYNTKALRRRKNVYFNEPELNGLMKVLDVGRNLQIVHRRELLQ